MHVNDERTTVLAAIEDAGGIHTLADLARRWGVSRARVHELSQSDGFPEPLMYIGKSPLWVGCEVDAWRAQERQGGRPKGGGS